MDKLQSSARSQGIPPLEIVVTEFDFNMYDYVKEGMPKEMLDMPEVVARTLLDYSEHPIKVCIFSNISIIPLNPL